MKYIAYACVFFAMTFVASAAGDETCARLKSFEFGAKPEAANATVRDWIEMRWMASPPANEIFHMECHHSGSNAAGKLCGWLVKNSSWEFPAFLPMRILECHGAKFPAHFEYSSWIASMDIEPDTLDGRRMMLDVAIGGHKGDNVVRYSVFVGTNAEEKNPLPPLFPSGDFVGMND